MHQIIQNININIEMNNLNRYIKRLLITLILLPVCGVLFAMPKDSCTIATIDTCMIDSLHANKVILPFAEYPFEITDNIIQNDSSNMAMWRKLIDRSTGENNETFRIMHIGDSHVKGGTFAETVGLLLKDSIPGVDYQVFGINGASYHSFATKVDLSRIYNYKPDLLIISFGTNESHARNYNSLFFHQQIDRLIRQLQLRLPRTTILLTTPPGSFLSSQPKGQKKRYAINNNTVKAAQTIKLYADKQHLMVWDLYNAVGGVSNACKNWLNSGLIYKDYLHYIAKGYELQGQLLYEAIMKTYNNYVDEQY